MRKGNIGVYLLAFFIVACTKMCSVSRKDLTPEQVVENYLQIAFNMKDVSQRALLLEYTTDELKVAISGATEGSLQAAYIKPRYNLKSWSFIDRVDRTPRAVELSYRVEYDELPESGKISEQVSVETKNTVLLVKKDHKWFIKDVIGSNTAIEFPILKQSKIKVSQ